MNILERQYKTWLLYFWLWLLLLIMAEYFRIKWTPNQIVDFLSLAIPAMTALMALVVAIAASRLEVFKDQPPQVGSVKKDFSKFGTRVMVATGIFLVVTSVGISSTHQWILNSEIKLHIGAVIMSAMTALVIYGISGAISYFKNW